MMNINAAIVILFVGIGIVNASEVKQCQNSNARKLDTTEVEVSNCPKGVCRLRRKTTVGIELKFKPERDIKQMITTVNAIIVGIPLPFIGVDGTSACDNVYLEDGKTKTNCPLKAGQNYVYKNQFNVLEIYPKLNLIVHWALTSNNRDVVCFELPAKIT